MTHLRVRELAEAQGLNISQLARKANIAYTSAHALWHDTITQLDRRTLDRIALVLGVTVNDLFGGLPDPEALKEQ